MATCRCSSMSWEHLDCGSILCSRKVMQIHNWFNDQHCSLPQKGVESEEMCFTWFSRNTSCYKCLNLYTCFEIRQYTQISQMYTNHNMNNMIHPLPVTGAMSSASSQPSSGNSCMLVIWNINLLIDSDLFSRFPNNTWSHFEPINRMQTNQEVL